MKKETRVTHQPEVGLPEGNRALVSPIYRSVKFSFPTIADSLDDDALKNLVTDLGGHDLGLLLDTFRACDAEPDRPSVVFVVGGFPDKDGIAGIGDCHRGRVSCFLA